MSEVRRIKVNKSVTKNKLLDYGFRYKENGDYRLYVPVYKWNDKTTIYAYFYVNMEENIMIFSQKVLHIIHITMKQIVK